MQRTARKDEKTIGSSDGAMGAIGMGGGHVTLSHSRFVSVVWASVAIGFPVLSTDRFFNKHAPVCYRFDL